MYHNYIVEEVPTKSYRTLMVTFNPPFGSKPSDSISIIPPNSEDDVNKMKLFFYYDEKTSRLVKDFLYSVGMDKKEEFDLQNDIITYFFRYYVDMYGYSKRLIRQFLESVNSERTILIDENDNESKLYVFENMLNNYLETFQYPITYFLEKANLKFKLDNFIKIFRMTKPRHYSLINDNQIFVRVHERLLELGKCSRFFLDNRNSRVDIKIRESKLLSFNYTTNPKKKSKSKINQNDLISTIKYPKTHVKNKKLPLFLATGTGIAAFLYYFFNTNDEFNCVYGFREDEDNLINYIDLDKINTKCNFFLVSSKDIKIDEYLSESIFEPSAIYICGNPNVQKKLFNVIKKKWINIVNNRLLYFDSWL